MNLSRNLLLIACAWSLAGCSLPMNGLHICKAGISTTRPAGTIGPSEAEGDAPWQTYIVEVPATYARVLAALDSTFHLEVTDCRRNAGMIIENGLINNNGLISVEDVYVNGITLNGSHTSDNKRQIISSPVIQGVAYLSASRIKSNSKLCFRASGGSMIGVGFKSNIVKVDG